MTKYETLSSKELQELIIITQEQMTIEEQLTGIRSLMWELRLDQLQKELKSRG